MLEQVEEHIRNISQDMQILNRSCGEELVHSSLTRARRSAPKKRRRAQRKIVRPIKQACNDTIEETTSSTDKAVAHRKRARFYQRINTLSHHTHTMTDTSIHLHVTTFRSHYSSFMARCTSTASGARQTTIMSPVNPLLHVLNQDRGGYAGIRVGVAENPGPATHDRDWTATEQPLASHRRINEAGDSVPSGQDSTTRGVRNLQLVQNLHISGSPSSTTGSASPATGNHEEF